MTSGTSALLEVIEQFAPGTRLRDAAELILRQRTGALVVFGAGPEVDAVCSGGFLLSNTEFTAQRIAELAKMDGGIVVSADATSIVRVNVQFIPDPTIETSETGTRFRTAERLAKHLAVPVLAVSEEQRAVAVVFTGQSQFTLRNPGDLLAEGNQNLVALERLRRQLSDAEDRLTRLEVDDAVMVRDVALLLARAALVRRMGAQIRRIVVELGGAGDLIAIQASDLGEGVDNVLELVVDDYAERPMAAGEASDRLRNVPDEALKDLAVVADAFGLGSLDEQVRPRGGRALERVSRLPDSVKNSLLEHFGTLQKLLHASASELAEAEGVGRTRANQLRGHLDRLLQHGTPFGLVD